MSTRERTPTPELPFGSGGFATTRWSVVAAAAGRGPQAAAALEQLCDSYCGPVYVFLRRTGNLPDDAADLMQGFFARLLEKRDLVSASRERGRFRAFLLGAVKHFAANQRDRERALKRGGGFRGVSLEADTAEQRFQRDLSDNRTPESAFLHRWATDLLSDVLERLGERYRLEGKAELFGELSPHLSAEEGGVKLADSAKRLGMTENAVKVALHRLRRRYRDLLRGVVADTLTDPADIDDEIRFLIASLQG
ncbi:MAG: sigma-70 family RNA polymerase sigma factor [Candidatus Sumerlaeaceae bacterium]|nr:sigma-70 family RNA polymerase sigma factor [Candidatus Sumerlaeaceae bacterium]